VYLQKIGNITHIHMVQEPENRFNITNKSPWKPNVSNFIKLYITLLEDSLRLLSAIFSAKNGKYFPNLDPVILNWLRTGFGRVR
jgi:hypothetical protein